MSPRNQTTTDLLDPREVLDQAVAVLMADNGLDREAAFEILVQRSGDSHQRVRAVAGEIVKQSRRSE